MAIAPKRVQAAFLEAVAATPDERAGVLDRVCAGDPELRRRVELLLRAHDEPGELSSVAGTGDYVPRAADAAARADLQPGDIFAGRYKLREKLGEGGMGVVWVADQTSPVQRRIALKVIKSSDDPRRLLARFEQERQALALMDHPNIAKVLDAGVGDDGRPYFVMELIKGVPLTRYCDEAKLPPKERLELFVAVCQAVQHAHQKGIIHRDLKPSNILVGLYDGRPVPKVIDFGVAKATGPRLSEPSVYTEVGAMIGTLEYMSPEQAALNNLDIDTRSDVYSLGVILYELLTGTVPFSRKDLKAAGFAEMLRIIKEVEPPKPSTRLSGSGTLPSVAALRHTEPKKLARLVRGELDWIVMKCLEKERSRRFETANGLARDVQRYLADEVIEARPPSAGYRLRKFVQRHKGQVLAAVAVAAALVAGVAAVVAVQVRANRHLAAKNAELAEEQAKVEARNKELADEQQKVQARFELAQKAIATFHTGVTEDALLKHEQFRELRTNLLRKAAEFYDDLGKLLDGRTDVRSRKQLADAYFQLARLTDTIGSTPEALAVHQKALAVRRELAAAPGADAETRLDVIRSLTWVARLRHALGDLTGVLGAVEEALARTTALESENPTEAVRAQLARNHVNAGFIRATMAGKPLAALDAYKRGLAIQQKLVEDNPEDAKALFFLGSIQTLIGEVLHDAGRPAEGLRSCSRALVNFQKLVDADPTNPEFQSALAAGHNVIGLLLSEQGQPAEAMTAHERARVIRQKLVDDKPAIHTFQYDLAQSHLNIGRIYTLLGRSDEAVASLDRAVAICPKQAEEQSVTSKATGHLAYVYAFRGQAHARFRHPVEAAADLRHALELFAKIRLPDGRDRVEESRALALLAHLGADMRSGVSPVEAATFADRAVAALALALKAGWVKLDPLNEPDFDAVRNRADFRKLVAELEAKAKERATVPPSEEK